jgi:hypothetical protein
MYLFKILLLVIILTTSLFSNEKIIKLGILYEKLFTTSKEAKIGARVWIKQMEKQYYGFKIELKFYNNEKKLMKDYKNKKIISIISDASLYYEHKKELDDLSGSKWIMSNTNNVFDKYYLIKNKNFDFSFNDLENKNFFFKDEMSSVWFESIMLKNGIEIKPSRLKKIEKPRKLIFNCFFNKNDLSIVSKDLYDSMVSLNPQIKKKIDIVIESESIFFKGIGFTRKNIEEYQTRIFNSMSNNLWTVDNDFKKLSFSNIQKVFILKEGDLSKTDLFYKNYFRLKKGLK